MADEMKIEQRPIEIIGQNVDFWAKDLNLSGVIFYSCGEPGKEEAAVKFGPQGATRTHIVLSLKQVIIMLNSVYIQNEKVSGFCGEKEKEYLKLITQNSAKLLELNGQGFNKKE